MAKKHSIFDPVEEIVNDESIKDEAIEEKKVEPKKNKKVTVEVDNLNIRKGPGLNFEKTGSFAKKGKNEITEEKDGFGKLADGTGWISLKYTK